jgi:AcrR family transcriptional regulator
MAEDMTYGVPTVKGNGWGGMSITNSHEEGLSLQAQKRELTRRIIGRSAATVMADKGFAATVDEVARVAGVSSRTVFRHFPAHDLLLAAGVREMVTAIGAPIIGLPDPEDDLDGWIDCLALEAHKRNTEVMGRAFWEVCNIDPDASGELASVCTARRSARLQWMAQIAARAWAAAGGRGKPPQDLLEMFVLLFSPFARNGLAVDCGHTPERSAKLAAASLKTLLRAAVDSQARAVRKRERQQPQPRAT